MTIAAFDFTVLGGSNGDVGMRKIGRCIQASLDDRIPLVLLCDAAATASRRDSIPARGTGSTMLTRLVDLSGLVPPSR